MVLVVCLEVTATPARLIFGPCRKDSRRRLTGRDANGYHRSMWESRGVQMKAAFKSLIVAASLVFVPHITSAGTIRWELSGVTFDDGGAATGWFDTDSETLVIGRWSIFTSAGTGVVGAHVYTPSNGIARRANPFVGSVQEYEFVTSPWQLRMTPNVELDASGGAHDLNISANSDNVECNNCGSARPISAGQLIGITDEVFGDGFD